MASICVFPRMGRYGYARKSYLDEWSEGKPDGPAIFASPRPGPQAQLLFGLCGHAAGPRANFIFHQPGRRRSLGRFCPRPELSIRPTGGLARRCPGPALAAGARKGRVFTSIKNSNSQSGARRGACKVSRNQKKKGARLEPELRHHSPNPNVETAAERLNPIAQHTSPKPTSRAPIEIGQEPLCAAAEKKRRPASCPPMEPHVRSPRKPLAAETRRRKKPPPQHPSPNIIIQRLFPRRGGLGPRMQRAVGWRLRI